MKNARQVKPREATEVRNQSVETLRRAIEAAPKSEGEKKLTIREVAERAGVSPKTLYNLLERRTSAPRYPEVLERLAVAVGLGPDPSLFPELGRLSDLSREARWLHDRLVATRLTRSELSAALKERAEARGLNVRCGPRRLNAILDGTRVFPGAEEGALRELLVEVTGGEPVPAGETDAEAPDWLDLTFAESLVQARARLRKGDRPPGVVGTVAARLDAADTERDAKTRETAARHQKVRRQVILRALNWLAEPGRGLADLLGPRGDRALLARLLLGLEDPDRHPRFVEDLGSRLGLELSAGESLAEVEVTVPGRKIRRARTRTAKSRPEREE